MSIEKGVLSHCHEGIHVHSHIRDPNRLARRLMMKFGDQFHYSDRLEQLCHRVCLVPPHCYHVIIRAEAFVSAVTDSE